MFSPAHVPRSIKNDPFSLASILSFVGAAWAFPAETVIIDRKSAQQCLILTSSTLPQATMRNEEIQPPPQLSRYTHGSAIFSHLLPAPGFRVMAQRTRCFVCVSAIHLECHERPPLPALAKRIPQVAYRNLLWHEG
jgi:hypothetical protein